MAVRISAFPKCFIDQIASGGMTLFEWIEMAKPLRAEGLEMYERFFLNFESDYLRRVRDAIQAAGFAMPMFCCSPDFTAPDPDQRKREIEREAEMIKVTRFLGGPHAVCRILSGQRYPEVSWEQGRDWVLEAIHALLPLAKEHDVVLGMENHYKDGFWRYPEFAQKMDRFTEIVNAVPDRDHFGVQYDPSNALVAGDDPLALLRAVADRVVSMHASDRYLAEGAKLEDLRGSDGTIGYSDKLRHGVTGKGLNDYNAIFQILAEHRYAGWISIEDGMNGMEEMTESIAFLQKMRQKWFQ
jgi:sugar phosphate isomerase/epimerase